MVYLRYGDVRTSAYRHGKCNKVPVHCMSDNGHSVVVAELMTRRQAPTPPLLLRWRTLVNCPLNCSLDDTNTQKTPQTSS